MSPWIETIALKEGQPLRLAQHQQRLNATLAAHQSRAEIELESFLAQQSLPLKGYYKLRVAYTASGVVDFECSVYQPKVWQSFEIIEVPDLDYRYKSSSRTVFAQLKAQSNADEVIIAQQGVITDTTYSNLVFEKEGEWFTPSSYLLRGTQRQFLLERGYIKEASITCRNLASYQNFKLINAMLSLEDSTSYPVALIQNRGQSLLSASY